MGTVFCVNRIFLNKCIDKVNNINYSINHIIPIEIIGIKTNISITNKIIRIIDVVINSLIEI
ncbi:hypothetical protein B0H39_005793 [Clostridium beijerinckii]|uniref:Uncharacterized protein n=1 Tax=Clostridium diolis TaxID=223919 RepID=A0AAV3VWS0_9CLOT|nr:hypothetical protein X276_04860 [Clostridium beijerinckii NRRL B-598]NOW87762.1 hypothetical protein [Clostridium beijerinckii]GEA29199.1 hypothetical protein CDIOL_01220 [Clostridium diolis]